MMIAPSTQDVVSGGGSFSACLQRAIRRPLPSRSSAENNDDTRRYTHDGGNDDDGNTPSSGDFANQDWTTHHISYTLLSETLCYFSRRRDEVAKRLRLRNPRQKSSNWTLSEGELAEIISEYRSRAPFNGHGSGNDDHNTRDGMLNNDNGSQSNINGADGVGDDNYCNLCDAESWNNTCESGEKSNGKGNNYDIMEYAEQRALGRKVPGGLTSSKDRRSWRRRTFGTCTANDSGDMDAELDEADVYRSMDSSPNDAANSNDMHHEHDSYGSHINNSKNCLSENQLTKSEITTRLSHLERTELSALLDSEVQRAATFYRSRIAELAPPREDGGTIPTFGDLCGAMEGCNDFIANDGTTVGTFSANVRDVADMSCGEYPYGRHPSCGGGDCTVDGKNTDEEDVNSLTGDQSPSNFNNHASQNLSFTDMASEILELHAFITTNIIVIRQVLIRYDAFARSLGGSPMSSWYQTTRRQRGKKGLKSDYGDLVHHSKLKKLTKAYIQEYGRHVEEAKFMRDEELGRSGSRRRRRLRGFSKAYHRLVDKAENIKKKQRMKWRQSAMHWDEDDDDVEGKNTSSEHVRLNTSSDKIDTSIDLSRTTTPPAMSFQTSSVETPMTHGTPCPPTPTPNPPIPSSIKPSSDIKPPNYSNFRGDEGEDIAWQVHVFKCIQSKTQRSVEKSEMGKISGVYDNAIVTLRDYFLIGSVSDNLSLQPSYLVMRGKSLQSSLLVVAQWREQRNQYRYGTLATGGMPTDSAMWNMQSKEWFGGFCGESRPETKTPIKNSFPLALNIFGCFLYMQNYYIVEPSSTRYANALGMNDAMSGLIIGAMPWAAIISAITFSIWTNKCFRSPLIFSGVLLVSGNLLYATAFRYGSIEMALCGRFMTGLGGPRSINRRYIADTTPLAHRTAVNAAFGTATALGAALGPATAILLDSLDVVFYIPVYGAVHLNGMTGPGFLMGILWLIFTLLLVFTFTEPERSGLEEQRQKELMMGVVTPTSSTVVGKSEFELTHIDTPTEKIKSQNGSCISRMESQAFPEEAKNIDSISPTQDASSNSLWSQFKHVASNLTLPVRISMFLLFSKMFTVESLISAASMVTKNRYHWAVQQVGTLGTIVGCLTIPISVFIGFLSQYREDRVLMLWLMMAASFGMALLIDISDLISTETDTYNEENMLAVGPHRYVAGYLIVFCSMQAFDGVVGSVLSKVIPTALATGTFNSGLFATLVGTVSLICCLNISIFDYYSLP
ncbi:hypothetical protein ACHAXS_004310 [Conticribra weissflogii]